MGRTIIFVVIASLFLFLVGAFVDVKPALAIDEAKITSPYSSPNNPIPTVSGIYLFQGTFIYSAPASAIFKIDGAPACGPIMNPGMSFGCNFNSTLKPDGLYNLQLIVNYYNIDYPSATIQINIINQNISSPPPSGGGTTTPGSKETPSAPSPSPSASPSATPTPAPTTTLTSMPIPGRPDLSPIPVVASSTKIQNNYDLINISTVVNTIYFKLDQDKPLHLEKIEQRQTESKTNFLLFVGKSYPNSEVKITIQSEPLVMSVEADDNGNWNYILQDPLEPGEHQTFVEVNNNGQIETSGPYPFNIARAQATFNNPTGASLNIIDPQKQALKNYLFLALGLLVVAILILLIFIYFKRSKRLNMVQNPPKEAGAV
jgi:hypothetical protein